MRARAPGNAPAARTAGLAVHSKQTQFRGWAMARSRGIWSEPYRLPHLARRAPRPSIRPPRGTPRAIRPPRGAKRATRPSLRPPRGAKRATRLSLRPPRGAKRATRPSIRHSLGTLRAARLLLRLNGPPGRAVCAPMRTRRDSKSRTSRRTVALSQSLRQPGVEMHPVPQRYTRPAMVPTDVQRDWRTTHAEPR